MNPIRIKFSENDQIDEKQTEKKIELTVTEEKTDELKTYVLKEQLLCNFDNNISFVVTTMKQKYEEKHFDLYKKIAIELSARNLFNDSFKIDNFNLYIKTLKDLNITKFKKDEELLSLLAKNYSDTGHVSEAIDIYQTLIETHPDIYYWHLLGLEYIKKQDFLNAQNCYIKASETNPKKIYYDKNNAYCKLGYLYFINGKFDDALKQIELLGKSYNVEFRYISLELHGDLQLEMGNLQKCLDLYQQYENYWQTQTNKKPKDQITENGVTTSCSDWKIYHRHNLLAENHIFNIQLKKAIACIRCKEQENGKKIFKSLIQKVENFEKTIKELDKDESHTSESIQDYKNVLYLWLGIIRRESATFFKLSKEEKTKCLSDSLEIFNDLLQYCNDPKSSIKVLNKEKVHFELANTYFGLEKNSEAMKSIKISLNNFRFSSLNYLQTSKKINERVLSKC